VLSVHLVLDENPAWGSWRIEFGRPTERSSPVILSGATIVAIPVHAYTDVRVQQPSSNATLIVQELSIETDVSIEPHVIVMQLQPSFPTQVHICCDVAVNITSIHFADEVLDNLTWTGGRNPYLDDIAADHHVTRGSRALKYFRDRYLHAKSVLFQLGHPSTGIRDTSAYFHIGPDVTLFVKQGLAMSGGTIEMIETSKLVSRDLILSNAIVWSRIMGIPIDPFACATHVQAETLITSGAVVFNATKHLYASAPHDCSLQLQVFKRLLLGPGLTLERDISSRFTDLDTALESMNPRTLSLSQLRVPSMPAWDPPVGNEYPTSPRDEPRRVYYRLTSRDVEELALIRFVGDNATGTLIFGPPSQSPFGNTTCLDGEPQPNLTSLSVEEEQVDLEGEPLDFRIHTRVASSLISIAGWNATIAADRVTVLSNAGRVRSAEMDDDGYSLSTTEQPHDANCGISDDCPYLALPTLIWSSSQFDYKPHSLATARHSIRSNVSLLFNVRQFHAGAGVTFEVPSLIFTEPTSAVPQSAFPLNVTILGKLNVTMLALHRDQYDAPLATLSQMFETDPSRAIMGAAVSNDVHAYLSTSLAFRLPLLRPPKYAVISPNSSTPADELIESPDGSNRRISNNAIVWTRIRSLRANETRSQGKASEELLSQVISPLPPYPSSDAQVLWNAGPLFDTIPYTPAPVPVGLHVVGPYRVQFGSHLQSVNMVGTLDTLALDAAVNFTLKGQLATGLAFDPDFVNFTQFQIYYDDEDIASTASGLYVFALAQLSNSVPTFTYPTGHLFKPFNPNQVNDEVLPPPWSPQQKVKPSSSGQAGIEPSIPTSVTALSAMPEHQIVYGIQYYEPWELPSVRIDVAAIPEKLGSLSSRGWVSNIMDSAVIDWQGNAAQLRFGNNLTFSFNTTIVFCGKGYVILPHASNLHVGRSARLDMYLGNWQLLQIPETIAIVEQNAELHIRGRCSGPDSGWPECTHASICGAFPSLPSMEEVDEFVSTMQSRRQLDSIYDRLASSTYSKYVAMNQSGALITGGFRIESDAVLDVDVDTVWLSRTSRIEILHGGRFAVLSHARTCRAMGTFVIGGTVEILADTCAPTVPGTPIVEVLESSATSEPQIKCWKYDPNEAIPTSHLIEHTEILHHDSPEASPGDTWLGVLGRTCLRSAPVECGYSNPISLIPVSEPAEISVWSCFGAVSYSLGPTRSFTPFAHVESGGNAFTTLADSSLPSGLTFHESTGLITGVPTHLGEHVELSVLALNQFGQSTPIQLVIMVTLPCPSGSYCDLVGSSVVAFECPESKFCPGNTTIPFTCLSGNYCPAGSALPTPCPKGTYCTAGRAAPQPCPKGFYCPFPDTLNLCPAGSLCPEGSTAPHPCHAATLPLPGYYCPEGQAEAQQCPAGYY